MRRAHSLMLAGLFALPLAARGADLIVSSNDGHTVMRADGALVAPPNPRPDTVSTIDVTQYPPKLTTTIECPGSVVGPPMSVWVAPDQSWAIVTSATKADSQGKDGISPDNRVSVLDLTQSPPKITQSLTAGAGATAVRVAPSGGLALVANRMDGTVSIFTVQNHHLTPVGQVELGKHSGPSGLLFLKEGNTALVSRNFDHQVAVLHINGAQVAVDERPITTGIAPYTMDMNSAGTLVGVSNMGRGDGDADSVSLIDVTQSPPRTVATLGVAPGPEPLKFSPDGRYLAVGAENGSTLAQTSPFHHKNGLLQILAVDGQSLRKIAESQTGVWVEGVAFSRDGRTVMLQSMADKTIEVFRFENDKLTAGDKLSLKEGPEAFGYGWE